jgi:ABC-type oligopeptide transport system ATPase subunit
MSHFQMLEDVLTAAGYESFDKFTEVLHKEYSFYFVLIHHKNKHTIDYSSVFGNEYKKLCLTTVRDSEMRELETFDFPINDYIFIPKNLESINEFAEMNKIVKYDQVPSTEGIVIRVFDANHNFGVWSRFLIGLLAPTEYVCVFDDDTIPGSKWFENCVTSMNAKEALYGTIGVVFVDTEIEYNILHRFGWDAPNPTTKYVDIVGHSWFFKRDWLSYLVKEPLDIYSKKICGEDMCFSFMLQKYASIPTCVPPHPPNSMELWGSNPHTAWKYGCDANAISTNNNSKAFSNMYAEYISKGFRRLITRTYATSESDLDYFLTMLQDKKPFALIRPADGEHIVLQNRTLTNIDNWTFTAGSKLHTDLMNAITLASNTSCYIGIPCSCCNDAMAKWYVNRFSMNPLYTTFANIFVNANWKKWVNFLTTKTVSFTLVAPYNKSSFLVNNHIEIPEFLVNTWDTDGEQYITKILEEVKKKKNHIYMFSGGPVSKILIARAWAAHPHNIYIDIGSSLDIFLKGHTNRDYTVDGTHNSSLVCKFNNDLIQV